MSTAQGLVPDSLEWWKAEAYRLEETIRLLRVEAGPNASGLLTHAQACRLSRVFNQNAKLDRTEDWEINEWLKRLITNTQRLVK